MHVFPYYVIHIIIVSIATALVKLKVCNYKRVCAIMEMNTLLSLEINVYTVANIAFD